MKKNPAKSLKSKDLRQSAETQLGKHKEREVQVPLTMAEIQHLLNELEVHQIELEMQNEELTQSRTEAEAQYADLYEFAPVGYFTLGKTAVIQKINLTGALLLGVDHSQLVERQFGLLVKGEFREPFKAFLKKVFESKLKETCDIMFVNQARGPFWAHLEGTASENGESCRLVVLDISESKRAEDALRESEEKYRRIVDAAGEGIWMIDAESKTTFVNLKMAEMLGYSVDEMLGVALFTFMDEEGKAIAAAYVERRRQGIKEQHDFKIRRKDGTDLWVILETNPVFDNDGQYAGALAMVADITDRKRAEEALRESEERFKLLFDRAPVGYQSLNKDGNFIVVNDTWLEIFGYSKEEVVGKWFGDFLAPEYVEGFNERFPLFKACGKIHSEFEMVRKSGARFFVAFDGLIGHTPLGEFQQTHCVLNDITERKQAEKTIREYAENLEQRVVERTAELVRANRVKDEFLANMSHELRTPLNSILGFSETLLEGIRGPLNERQEQGLQLIYSSGQHLLGLINDILDIAKIEVGKFELHPEIVSVNDICHASLNFIKEMAGRKSILVEYSSSPDVSSMQADPKRLKQILVNLLNNAVKFTPEKGRVSLDVQTDTRRSQMRFSVTDTGIGIASDDLEKLFKPFVQLDSSLSRQYEGSGLGLMLVQKLVEMHGGEVHVESAVGSGSSFTVVLPWKQNADLNNAESFIVEVEEESKPSSRPTLLSGTGARILLAEDNEFNVMVIRDYLEAYGYQVFIAQHGAEAIAMANEIAPALILMDVQMPEMDGLESIRRLRATPGFDTVPIIALTAFAMSDDRERCLAAGANEYLSKPVKLRMLRKFIEKFIGDGRLEVPAE